MKELKRNIAILCSLLILLVFMLCYWTIIFINDKNTEIKCYRTLINEDYIDKGCEDYFKNDDQYIDYQKDLTQDTTICVI